MERFGFLAQVSRPARIVYLTLLLVGLMTGSALAQEFMATGSYTGNGLHDQAITGLGFQPDLVLIKSTENKRGVLHTSLMPPGEAKKLADNKSLETGHIDSLDPDGFTVGNKAETNNDGVVYYYVAMVGGTDQIHLDEYVGNGSSIRWVSTPDFTPTAVLVLPEGSDDSLFRHWHMDNPSTYCVPLDNSGQITNGISFMVENGFYVGNNHSVNENGKTYYVVAFTEVPGSLTLDSYTADDQPGRQITGLGMAPEYVMVFNNGNGDHAHRPESVAGTGSLFFRDRELADELITSLDADGFTVGTRDAVHQEGQDFFWLALANPPQDADLSVTLGVDNDFPSVGETVRFTLGLKNAGPQDTDAVAVDVVLPTGLTYAASSPGQGTYDSGTGRWTVGAMAFDATAVLTLDATVDAGTGGSDLETTATIQNSSVNDPEPLNDSSSRTISVVASTGTDLSVELGLDEDQPVAGQALTYTMTVKNNGPDSGSGIVAQLTLPSGLTYTGDTPSQGAFDSGSGEWTLGDLVLDASATLQVACTVDAATEGSTLTTDASITSLNETDPSGANDSQSIDATVQYADLGLSLLANLPAAGEGEDVSFTAVCTNHGPGAATGTALNFLLPAGMVYQSHSTATGTYNDGTGLWTIGSLASGQSVFLNVIAQPAGGTAGTNVDLSATIASVDQADDVPGNNSAALAFPVAVPSDIDLALGMTLDQSAPNVGDMVTFTVSIDNATASDASGVAASFPIPGELSFVNALTNKGTFDEATGVWNVGDLSSGYQAQLSVQAIVLSSAVGVDVNATAAITAADQNDPDAGNNTDSTTLTVPLADLDLTLGVDDANPVVGQQVILSLDAENLGPNAATSAVIQFPMPAGMSLVGHTADSGTWDSGTGLWTLSGINPGQTVTLTVTATVEAAAAGTDPTFTATITDASPLDPVSTNNNGSVTLDVTGADLELSLNASSPTAGEGDQVTFTLNATNNGPDAASGVILSLVLPAGLEYESFSSTQGNYASGSGQWLLSTLSDGQTHTLEVTASVAAGTAGSNLVASAGIASVNEPDPQSGNDMASSGVLVTGTNLGDVLVWSAAGTGETVHPGASGSDSVLEIEFWNSSGTTRLLDNVTVTNLTEGAGDQADRDGAWSGLTLQADGQDATAVTAAFSGGSALFSDLGWSIPAGDTLRVSLLAAASTTAPDGLRLRAGIASAGDIDLDGTFTLAGSYPLTSGHSLLVDGFVAAQVSLGDLEAALLPIGSQDNLVLAVDLPANGYLADSLQGISLINSGTAQPEEDIAAIKVWAENGGAGFDPATDLLLGTTVFSGDRYNLSGLNVPIPVGGRRFYATVDISETADPTLDIRLSLPGGSGFAVEMHSGNDGPLDEDIINPVTMGVSVTDRMILTAEWSPSDVVLPGDNDVVLLKTLLTNTYADARTLQRLDFHNTSVAPGLTDGQRDLMFRQLSLRLDDGNGELDGPDVDDVLFTGSFSDTMVSFTGLDLELPGDTATRLFVTADLDLHTVPVDAELSGHIAVPGDMDIPDATLIARWPVTAGTVLMTDGMTAGQITVNPLPVLTLGPDEGPVLALDLEIPGNGPLADILEGIQFTNEGTATDADIATARLWADGGNGVFDGTDGDDEELCNLTIEGDRWSSPILDHELLPGGNRLFASLKVASSPSDSVTVQLGLVRNAVTVASNNDGPLDDPIPGEGTLVISTSPLRTSLAFDTSQTCTGQSGQLSMLVVNAGSEPVLDISPTLLFQSGVGLMSLGDPSPATINSLDPGQEATITWSSSSLGAGTVVVAGNAEGRVGVDQDRFSVITATGNHQVFTPVPNLELYPTANLPFSINRGQENLVPFTLTLINPGGGDVADAELTGLKLRLLETAVGPGIVPADLVTRAVVHEGTETYVTATSMPNSGDVIDLVFDQPVVITGDEPVTLSLRLDLDESATQPSFLVSLEEASYFTGNDAVNGASVTITLPGADFPVHTGQTTLVAPAAGLDLAVQPDGSGHAVPGQENILLAEIDLTQANGQDGASAIGVGRLAFVFRNENGQAIPDPETWFASLKVLSTYQEHFDGPPVVESDSLVVLTLTSPITVGSAAPQILRLEASLTPEAPLGDITPVIVPSQVDARDANMNNQVPVTLSTGSAGPPLMVVGPAADLGATGIALMPQVISRGTRDLAALTVNLTNPGEETCAPASCDTLVLQVLDDARQHLNPLGYLERVDAMLGDQLVGTALDPADEAGLVVIELEGVVVEPGETISLTIRLDVAADSPDGGLEITLPLQGILASDTYSGLPVSVLPSEGGSASLTSGLAQIVDIADELRVGAESMMPPMLAPQAEPYPVMSLRLENPADAGAGGIQVNGIRLLPGAAKAEAVTFAAALDSVMLVHDGQILAVARDFDGGTSLLLEPSTALLLDAGDQLDLTVEAAIKAGAPAGQLTFMLDEEGVMAGPPGGGGIAILVLPVSGQIFPMETEAGNLAAATLADSYANYPNPFAAGREETTFAFALDRQATVRLRILTPHGELVRDILEDEPRAPGLHQSDLWNGRNGNGSAVHNGVYLAELIVTYNDGSTDRHLRKVAVVR